jgi:hypothetical protein
MHLGEGWQQRWLSAGADTRLDWLDTLPTDSPAAARTKRTCSVVATNSLMLNRIVLPATACWPDRGP